jgi:hypothetical protein
MQIRKLRDCNGTRRLHCSGVRPGRQIADRPGVDEVSSLHRQHGSGNTEFVIAPTRERGSYDDPVCSGPGL